MLKILSLLLPALIPSWRFFSAIAPSPRIEFALIAAARNEARTWVEFRPRPARLSISSIIGRLFWNSDWNESLFLVGCAERLIQNSCEHSRQEIFNRIVRDIRAQQAFPSGLLFLQFRLVFIKPHRLDTSEICSICVPSSPGRL